MKTDKHSVAQRERRAKLKKEGYKQILLTLDPQALAAARRIHHIMGGNRQHVIKSALLLTAAVLEMGDKYRPRE